MTLHFTEYILWIKHKTKIKYQYILLVDSTLYYILLSDSSHCRNNTFKHYFVCRLSVNICSVVSGKFFAMRNIALYSVCMYLFSGSIYKALKLEVGPNTFDASRINFWHLPFSTVMATVPQWITPTAFGSGKKIVFSKICVNQIHIKQSIQHVRICIIVEEFMFFLVC